MNTLYARLKGGIKDYRIIFDEQGAPKFDIFRTPDLSNAQQYEPLVKDVPKNTWLYVEMAPENYEKMIEPYMERLSNDMEQLSEAEYAGVDVIYGKDGSKTYFSKVSEAAKVHEHGRQLLTFDLGGPIVNRSSFGIEIGGAADAIFDRAENTLYFMKFSSAKSLFKGMDVFYQDVTYEEKEDFLRPDLFELGPELNLDWISLADTLKIAAIRESGVYDFDDPEVRSKIKAYAAQYPGSGIVVSDEGRLIINEKRDLSAALKLLEQRYFTSELTGEKFVAGSTKKISK